MENITDFLKLSRGRLQNLLDKLQWTEESIMESDDSEKYVADAFKEFDGDEPLFPPSFDNMNSVVLGQDELQKLLKISNTKKNPQKFSDLQLNFTREEKLRIYQHVAEQRPETKIQSHLDEKMVAIADIVALKNREKKKRKKYRISKPTHTEEVRCLVELQMQALQQYLQQEKYCLKDKTLSCSRPNVSQLVKKSDFKEERINGKDSSKRSQKCDKNETYLDSRDRKYSEIYKLSSHRSDSRSGLKKSDDHKHRYRDRCRTQTRHRSRNSRHHSSSPNNRSRSPQHRRPNTLHRARSPGGYQSQIKHKRKHNRNYEEDL